MATLIEPTEGERKNGWDAASLTAFINESERHRAERFMYAHFGYGNRPKWMRNNPTKCDSAYNPFRW